MAWLTDGTHLNAIGVAKCLFVTLGVAIILGILVLQRVRRGLLRREIAHHLDTPLCFWCGHNLTGVPRERRIVVCPECGQSSPVRA